MATRYPTSTQWITFPVDLKDAKRIKWSEGSATYYTCKCYWGFIKDPSSIEDVTKPRAEFKGWEKLEIQGQTQLFIASQFVETSLRGGPHKNFHVKDLAEVNATSSADQKCGWATVQLNSFFHYGQSGSRGRYKRWIVYHPPISSQFSSPKPFQHRFTGLLSADIVDAVADTLPDVAEFHSTTAKKVAKLGVPIIRLGVEGLKNVIGHHLHQFLNVEEVTRVKEAAAKKTKDLIPAAEAIQAKEDAIAEAENKATDEKAIERAYKNLNNVQTSLEEASLRNDLVQRFVFITEPSDGLTFENLVDNLVAKNSLLEQGDVGTVSGDGQDGFEIQGSLEESAGNEMELPLGSQASAFDHSVQQQQERQTFVLSPVQNYRSPRAPNFRSKAAQRYILSQSRDNRLSLIDESGQTKQQASLPDKQGQGKDASTRAKETLPPIKPNGIDHRYPPGRNLATVVSPKGR